MSAVQYSGSLSRQIGIGAGETFAKGIITAQDVIEASREYDVCEFYEGFCYGNREHGLRVRAYEEKPPREEETEEQGQDNGTPEPLFPHVEIDEDGNEVWSFREQGGQA